MPRERSIHNLEKTQPIPRVFRENGFCLGDHAAFEANPWKLGVFRRCAVENGLGEHNHVAAPHVWQPPAIAPFQGIDFGVVAFEPAIVFARRGSFLTDESRLGGDDLETRALRYILGVKQSPAVQELPSRREYVEILVNGSAAETLFAASKRRVQRPISGMMKSRPK